MTSKELKEKIEALKNDVDLKNESYNIIVLNTPKGQVKIKTKLTLKEWLKKNNLIKKKK